MLKEAFNSFLDRVTRNGENKTPQTQAMSKVRQETGSVLGSRQPSLESDGQLNISKYARGKVESYFGPDKKSRDATGEAMRMWINQLKLMEHEQRSTK